MIGYKEKRVTFTTSAACDRECTMTLSNWGKPNEQRGIRLKNTSAVKKDLVRNVEECVSTQHLRMERRARAKPKYLSAKCNANVETQTAYKSKFEVPELYSSLCIAKAIRVTTNREVKTFLDYEDINPESRRAIKDKILLKLNIPFEEKLYKDLVAVKVDNDELVYQHSARREMASNNLKDLEPQLSNFCKPTGGREFSVWTRPMLNCAERLKYYNGFSLYKTCHTWKA